MMEKNLLAKIIADSNLVIPCAGNGTRMAPWSLLPKELLPVESEGVCRPILLDLLLKAKHAGVKMSNAKIVISDKKLAIREYFQADNSDLVAELYAKGKDKFARAVEEIPRLGDDAFVFQSGPYGNATPLISVFFETEKVEIEENGVKQTRWEVVSEKPILCEKRWTLYIFPDDMFLTEPERNEIEQTFAAFAKYGGSILPAKWSESDAEREKYAFAEGEVVRNSGGKAIKIETIIEKPGNRPIESDLACVKGYYLHPEFPEFLRRALEEFHPEDGEEFMIQDVIQESIKAGNPFFAVKIDGEYHDTGNLGDYKAYWKNA